MDQVNKGIQDRTQPLSTSDHSIPADPVNSIRDIKSEEMQTSSPSSTMPIATTSTTTTTSGLNTVYDTATLKTDQILVHSTSPKYASPPVGSGGKYMLKSKRASWIDASACDISESSPLSLPERLMAKQRKTPISDIGKKQQGQQGQQHKPYTSMEPTSSLSSSPVMVASSPTKNSSDINPLHKSGAPSAWLRGGRRTSLDQHATTSPSTLYSSSASSLSSYSADYSTKISGLPKQRQKALHITTATDSESGNRHRTSSISSIMTDSSTLQDDDDSSPCSSSTSYQPTTSVSPMFINQDKGKPAFLHDHSPGSSSPLSCEISSSSSLRNNSKRRSSMTLLKNIPSSELANIINGYTGSNHGDITGSPTTIDALHIKQNSRINTATTGIQASLSSTSSLSSSPSIPCRSGSVPSPQTSNNNGIPAYQHSLLSFFKRQLSAPKANNAYNNENAANDRDVVAFDLYNEQSTGQPTHHDRDDHLHSSTVYPALLLDGLGQDTKVNGLSSRKPSLYINTKGLLHGSAPDLCHWDDAMDYFALPVEMGKGLESPLSAPGNRFLPLDEYEQHLYCSRLRKINKWCHISWNDSKTSVKIFLRHGSNNRKQLKLLMEVPASDVYQDGTDLVNCIPWTNWMDEYQKVNDKPFKAPFWTCSGGDTVPSRTTTLSDINIYAYGSKSMTKERSQLAAGRQQHNLSLDLRNISNGIGYNGDYHQYPLDSSDRIMTPISADDSSVLSLRRISTSSSYLAGRHSSGFAPPCDNLGSVGYCYHDTGNRMGAFGRLGTILSGGGMDENSQHASSSSSSSTVRVRHTIKTRLQSAKNACNDEIRLITDGLNKYVERGLRYVECLGEDLEQEGPSDESDDHDDSCYNGLHGYSNSLSEDKNDGIMDFMAHGSNNYGYHPLQSATDIGKASILGFCASPGIEPPPLSSPSSSSSSSLPTANNISNSNIPARRRSIAIRLQNIEEQTELSSSETDQSQVTTPSDERLPKQTMMKLSAQQTATNQSMIASSLNALVPQNPSADLSSQSSTQTPSRYTMISEDAYLPTPFILALQDMITLAQTVLDTPLENYLENVGGCAAIVSAIQSVGKQWDVHPDWPCREWYVRLLLCVAALNRVLEWWEAERGFWCSWNTSFGVNGSFIGVNNTATNNVTLTAKSQPVNATKPALNCNDSETDDNIDELDFIHGVRYRSISETESAWSYMESQDDGSLLRNDCLPSTTLDYSDNNSIGGDYGQHLIGGDNKTMTGSTLLQEAVQRGQCNTIVLELTLETTVVQYLSPVWKQLIGSDSQEVIGKNISDLLVPADRHVFSTATTDLVQDTLRTVELRFSIQPGDAAVIEMEGKGMIMYNRVTGQPSHTMWVIKPLLHNPTLSDISPSSTTNKQLSDYSQIPIHDSTLLTERLIGNDHSLHLQIPDGDNAKDTWATKYDGNMEHYAKLRMRSISEPTTAATKDLPSESSQLDMIVSEKLGTNTSWSPPSATMRRAISHGGGSAYENNRLLSPTALMSLPPALCRVCERWVVATFFEQHSELCVELHRTEMDVIICNDNLCDLRQVALELFNKYQATLKMERLNADEVNNGDGIVKTGDIGLGASMDLDHSNLPDDNSTDDLERQKSNTVAMFEELLDILEVAISIPTPNNEAEDGRARFGINMKTDGDSDDEILATLKSKMVQIIYWRSPVIEDASLMTLVHEVEHQTKEKVEVVNRMRDRLEYNGRVRLDFQQSTQQDKGWTEYVDDKNSNQLATSTMNSNDSSKSFDSDNLCKQNDKTGNQSKRNFIGKCKHWKSKSAYGMTRMARMTKTRRQKRKARTTKGQPQIMEMETIDTPLASPGLSFETHSKLDSLQISDNNPTKQQHQPLIPSSAISTTSSSTNISIHRSLPPTIKDYDIIKPISKGAFGSVFLAKKRLTGDYYAIKFLKKSDMIAKNQVTNVKAERMILMTQTDSPFVTKLYYTFQSKDYLYLVLEYLNGGDCSALIKALGRLPEEWARNYLAEVTLGLAYLYEKNIIHRDLKPDNLLIDQNGHLKLTDFGLSRIGFLDRRVRDELSLGNHSDTNAPLSSSPAPSRSNTPPFTSSFAPSSSTLSPTLSNLYKHSYFSALFENDRQRRGSQASSSASICTLNEYSPRLQQQQQYEQIPASQNRHPYHHITSRSSSAASTPGWVDERSSFNWHRSSNGGSQVGKSAKSNNIEKNDNEFADTEHQTRKDFRAIGTPDYIAPESILGTGHDAMVDWWALGIICYEFLYGYPPFNDESPDKVFENILSRRIDWHENSVSVSEEARDFMEKLMTLDPSKRLGANGPEEVKQHPFFKNINWDNLLTESPSFVPQPVSEEDTTYFDARGATMQDHGLLDKDLLETKERTEVEHAKNIIMEQNPAKVTSLYRTGNNASHGTPDGDGENKLIFGTGLEQDASEFGAFVYKNLPLLEKANESAIRKLRHDSIAINAASPASASSIESLPSTPRTGGLGDGGYAPTTNWFHNSLPAISRKKRNSIFDFTSGSNGVNRPSISTSSSPSSLNCLTYTTSLPTTPSNLSPSTSSKVISASPSCIPIAPSRNINTNINKDNKGKFALSKPSSNKFSTAPRHRSVSSPGNRLLHMATGQITSSFAKIMKDGKLADEVGNDGPKPSISIDHGSQQNGISTTQTNDKSRHQQQQQHPITSIENTTSNTTCSGFVDSNGRGKSARILDCLLADDNPISCKILETILDRLHCRCVIVHNGAQAIRYAMGDVQFDLIFMDIRMPIIDGEAAARMIKSVKNRNQNTPIIAVTAYERTLQLADTFDDIVNKPITREVVQQRINLFCQHLDIDGSNVSSTFHHCHRSLAESSSTSNPSTANLYTTQPIPIPPPY